MDRDLLPRESISDSGGKSKIMYFPFSPSPPSTSYSTTPMDIPSSSRTRTQSPSCAYPSWPRRSSLSSSDSGCEEQAPVTSYISDDDLLFPCVFEDAECTPLATPQSSRSPTSTSMMPEQVVVDTGALMRQLIAEEKAKRERKRRGSRSSRKSRSGSSGKQMSPIQEVGE